MFKSSVLPSSPPSYGDKSNEELLFLYGFTLPGNPHDRLMLHVPLPRGDARDHALMARLVVMQARGYR